MGCKSDAGKYKPLGLCGMKYSTWGLGNNNFPKLELINRTALIVTRGAACLDCIPTQRVTAIKLRDTRVPKLPLGNPVSKAPALRAGKLELPVLNSQAGAWEPARKARCTASHEQRLNIRDAARGNESEISPRKSCPGAG